MRNRILFLFIAWASISIARVVSAYDQQVTSSLSVEGYTVYSRGGQTLSKRRVVGDVTLGAWNLLPDETDPYYRGPRLSMNLSFRIGGDMGIGKAESNPSSELSYVPGADPLSVNFMSGFLDAKGFWKDTLDVRLGRQVRLDTLGFFAMDGVDARLRLQGLEIISYIGLEVRGGQLLGFDNYELDGTDRGSREGLEVDRYPDREEAESRTAVGCELVLSPWKWIEAAAAFRAVGVIDDAGDMADQRAGGRLLLHADIFQASGRVVYNSMINALSEGDGEIGVTPIPVLGIFAEYHHYRPVFEGDSIFNVFDTAPQNDLGGRVEVDIKRTVDLAAWGFARLADGSGGLSGDESDAWVSGAGGGVGANYRTVEQSLSGRFSLVRDWGEQRIGAEIGGGHAFLRTHRLWLSFRLSYWHIDDDFSELYKGDVAGYVISGRFNITHRLYFLGEFEQYVGEGRPSRLTGFALLHMDLWR
jgi:hypothetical protein